MPILPLANGRVQRLSRNAVMVALAMIFSFVEHLLPLPLPGIKLGLANVVITAVFYMASPLDAAIVSLVRILLSALLFGTPVSFFFSLAGGVLAYLAMLACRPFYGRFFSFVGVSALAATGHHFGQIFAALTLYGSGVVLTYLPWLLVAGAVTGTLTGLLLNNLALRWKIVRKRGWQE